MKKLTWLSGFLALTVLVAGALTTAIPYRGKEGESYSVLNHFISELGEVGVSAFALLFNTSLILGGLALAVFMLGLSYFYSGLVAIMLFSVAIWVDRQRKLSRWLIVPGILTVASFASFLALPHLTGASHVGLLDPSRFTRPVVWLTPLLEWSVFFTMLTWVALTAADLALRGRSSIP